MQRFTKRFLSVYLALALLVTSIAVPEPAQAAGEPTVLTQADINTAYSGFHTGWSDCNDVDCHDPSIVVGYVEPSVTTLAADAKVVGVKDSTYSKEVYFVFGSHRKFHYSYDLKQWTSFSNNISTKYDTLFSVGKKWASGGSKTYSVAGNLWAPDVMWVPEFDNGEGQPKGAWLMYMSVNGADWHSSIALLKADSLRGDWTYVDTVVYSGFMKSDTNNNVTDTDYYKVTGLTDLPKRFKISDKKWNYDYGAHAIDPCIFRDTDNKLYMTYGSWSGGIYMLEIDPATGLRDKAVTYPYVENESDEYMGYKLAGGKMASGEASYITKIGDVYYMFLSYGGFDSDGGYNVRVFTADNIKGPYKDQAGNDARGKGAGEASGTVGNRMMANYWWTFAERGYVSEGHNSAFVDPEDGKAYIIYHSRYHSHPNKEQHNMYVHQLFTSEDKRLVEAPFRYSGETLSTSPYAADRVVGEYNVITQVSSGEEHLKKICQREKTLTLTADGKVSGAYTGTWEQSEAGPYLTIKVGDVSYKGVLIEQKAETTNMTTLCFTLLGDNNVCLWGYKSFDDRVSIAYNVKKDLGAMQGLAFRGERVALPSKGAYNVDFTWKSKNPDLISDAGVVSSALSEKSKATMELTVSKGSCAYVCEKQIDLMPKTPEETIAAGVPAKSIQAKAADMESFNSLAPSEKITGGTGLSVSFLAEDINDNRMTVLTDKNDKIKIGLSTLTIGDTKFIEKDAELSAAAKAAGFTSDTANKIFYNGKYYVTISFQRDGTVQFYRDGDLMLTYARTARPNEGSTKIPTLCSELVREYKQGEVRLAYKASNIIVGFAAGYDPNRYAPKDTAKYTYYADYDYKGLATDWTFGTDAVNYGLNVDAAQNVYMQMAPAAKSAADRPGFLLLGGDVLALTSYTVELDFAMSTGTTAGAKSEIALQSAFAPTRTNVTTLDSGLFKLGTKAYSASDSTTWNRWYVNDGSTYVEIDPGAWIHMSASVDGSAKKITVKLSDRATNAVLLSQTLSVSDASLGSIGVLLNRGSEGACIDNIRIFSGTTDPYAPVTVLKKNEIALSTKAILEKTASLKDQKVSVKASSTAKNVKYSVAAAPKDSKVKISAAGEVTIPKKYVGTITVTISSAKTAAYLAAANKQVKINVSPAKPTIKKVTAKAKALTVALKAAPAGAATYQIQVSTTNKFKAKTTATFNSKKLTCKLTGRKKNTNYFIRVRACKKAGSKTYYSAWSKIVKKKTKKK